MAMCGRLSLLVARFLFFHFRGVGNREAYFFLSFFVISFILRPVINQEDPYSQVDFFKFKPVFFGDVIIM